MPLGILDACAKNIHLQKLPPSILAKLYQAALEAPLRAGDNEAPFYGEPVLQ